MSVKTYTVLKPVLHNKRLYRRTRPIELSEEQARPLLASQHIGIPVETESAIVLPKKLTLSASTLGRMNLAELGEYAAAHDIVVASDATRDQIITTLTSATVEPVATV